MKRTGILVNNSRQKLTPCHGNFRYIILNFNVEKPQGLMYVTILTNGNNTKVLQRKSCKDQANCRQIHLFITLSDLLAWKGTDTDLIFHFIRLVHDNLLPLLGYSADGNHLCIVYKYMSRGSLEDALSCKVSGLNILPQRFFGFFFCFTRVYGCSYGLIITCNRLT